MSGKATTTSNKRSVSPARARGSCPSAHAVHLLLLVKLAQSTLEQCVKLRSCRRKLLHMGSPLLDKLFRLCTRASPGTMSSLCPWSFTTPRNTSLVLRTVRQPRPSQILSLGMGMSKPCIVAACWGANRSCVLLPGGEAATQRQAGAGKGDEARDKPPVRLRSVARC